MRIGIDIDGVLTDIEQWQLDFGSKYFYNTGKTIKKHGEYEVSEIFDVTLEEDNAFWSKYLLDYAKEEPARKFAREVIQKLKEEGYEIYIITARFLTTQNSKEGQMMRDIVINWLKENHIVYDKIFFSPEDKRTICKENKIDVMIEDSPKNIMQLSSHMPVICFHASYNKECSGENINRCYSWYDILEKIELLKKKNV